MAVSCPSMKLKSQREFWSGLLFALLGLAFAWAATGYDFGSSFAPGPGYLPFGLGLLLALFGGLMLFKSLAIEAERGDPVTPIAWRTLLPVLLALGGFAPALQRLGLLVTVSLFALLVLPAAGIRDRRALAMGVLLTPLLVFLLLVMGLGLPLPLWPAWA